MRDRAARSVRAWQRVSADVLPRDAGAASGLVNVAHQCGGSLGLGILVAVFAAASARALDAPDLFAHRVGMALTVGTAMLALALLLVLAPTRPAVDRHG